MAELNSLDILDTPPEPEFDELVRLAATCLGVTSAAISLVDEARQWFKARHGVLFSQTPREIAFCRYAVEIGDTILVPDATIDPRFSSNPLVIDGQVRFYAGVPLKTSAGHCIGSFCVFDPQPRQNLDVEHLSILKDLARLTSDLIESRRFRSIGEIAAKVVAATSDAVVAANSDGEIVYWNTAAEKMFGFSRVEALGKRVELIIPPRLAVDHPGIFARAAAGGPTKLVGRFVELEGMRSDGSEFPIELSLARWGDPASDQGFAAIVRDITPRRTLEKERQQAKALLDSVISNLPSMLSVKDTRTLQYVLINRAGEDILGKTAQEIVGATDRDLFSDAGQRIEQRDKAAIERKIIQTHESLFKREGEEPIHLRTTRIVIDGPDYESQFVLGLSENVTKARKAEADVLRLAQYDALTGLLNRQSYLDRLGRLIENSVPLAMLSIDLDRFKAVNDQFGHIVGDELLIEVAERLRSVAGPSDWIARVGGDEFVMILLEGDLAARAQEISESVVHRISEAFGTERTVAHIGASIGAVLFPRDGTSISKLRENSDLALYRAKHAGRGNACFFDADMDKAARERRTLETDLRGAINSAEITLAYQPIIAVSVGRVTSFEALARWNHRDRGPVPPNVFIPLAEESGLVDVLGKQLLLSACTDALKWPEDIRVAVNLSPLQFISGDLLSTVRQVLSKTGLTAKRLQLEVTEGLVIRDVERTFDQLQQLRELGIQILMDDFGTGYSSLSYFERFPFDKVKIDRSFVSEVTSSKAARAIISAVIGLGEELDMSVVAEGVETEDQMKMLVAMGCTHLQGYLFSKPLPSSEVPSLLEEQAFSHIQGIHGLPR